MAEYSGKSTQTEYQKDKMSVMHFNDKTQKYKVLAISPIPEKNDGAFLSIREGTKGEKSNRLTLALSKQEIAYIIMDLTKLFNELD